MTFVVLTRELISPHPQSRGETNTRLVRNRSLSHEEVRQCAGNDDVDGRSDGKDGSKQPLPFSLVNLNVRHLHGLGRG